MYLIYIIYIHVYFIFFRMRARSHRARGPSQQQRPGETRYLAQGLSDQFAVIRFGSYHPRTRAPARRTEDYLVKQVKQQVAWGGPPCSVDRPVHTRKLRTRSHVSTRYSRTCIYFLYVFNTMSPWTILARKQFQVIQKKA